VCDNPLQNLLAGQSVLNDNNWHTIRFSRRASEIALVAGRVRASVRLSDREKVSFSGEGDPPDHNCPSLLKIAFNFSLG